MTDANPRRKFYALAGGIAGVLLAVAIILFVLFMSDARADQEEADAAAARQAEAEAAEAARLSLMSDAIWGCEVGAIALQDEGKSIFLDSASDDNFPPSLGFAYGLTTAQVSCVLEALDTPDAVINHMSTTRALDGTQSDSWNDLSASWTYHPDSGLDIIIRLTED